MRPIVSDTWLRKRFSALSYPAPANDRCFDAPDKFFNRMRENCRRYVDRLGE